MYQKMQLALLLPLFLLTQSYSYGQLTACDIVWKKVVAREIAVDSGIFHKKYGHKHLRDSTLVEMLIQAVLAGQITAYSNGDINFSTVLSPAELRDKVTSRRDTFLVTDPVNGKEHQKVFIHEFKPASVSRFRFLEQWNYYPYSGKTEVQILGIAPIREIYASDGSFRGVQAMFWVKYEDAVSTLKRYDQLRAPEGTVRSLWDDYFSGDARPRVKGNIWKAQAVRIFSISPPVEDTIIHHLRDEIPDSTVMNIITAAKFSGTLATYTSPDSGFAHPLSKWDANEQWLEQIDTQFLTDPVTNIKVTRLMARDFPSAADQKAKTLESWTFEPATGKTEITIIALARCFEINGNSNESLRVRPLFWVKYEDVKAIIADFDQHHPTNTFASFIWNDYFTSDNKPELKKMSSEPGR